MMQVAMDAIAAAPALENPIGGLKPNWDALGTAFNNKFLFIFAAAWGLLILGTLFYVLVAVWEFLQHRGGNHPHEMSQARDRLKKVGMALGGEIMLPIIVGAAFLVFG